MGQEHITARVPEDIYREIERVQDEEKTDKSTTIKKLLEDGIENWKISNAIEKYQNGEASMGKAAELADVPVWEFMKILEERGIEPNYTDEEFEHDIALANEERG